jgi:sugar/nucleoside kinase (ribokinase family)
LDVIVVGSVALDKVKTPFSDAKESLGGSASYFSLAAAKLCKVGMVAVVGEDFPPAFTRIFKEADIDLSGLEFVPGKTFSWEGEYDYDLHHRTTLSTCLNVFENFHPRLPQEYRTVRYVFLANIAPKLQLEVLNQVSSPQLTVCDTMNFWISSDRKALEETLQKVDVLVINDAEVREITGDPSLIRAARKILKMGPMVVIVKKGEHGSLLITRNFYFSAPAYPVEAIADPTGAGDSFAGGFLGCLARENDLSERGMRRAVIFGTVMASFSVESFGVERLRAASLEESLKRFRELRTISEFDVD